MSDESSENGLSAVEPARAEAAPRVSEETYRSIFAAMDEGFCVVEELSDDPGRPFDYRFVATNRAFERHTGLANAVGKTVRQMVPGHDAHWIGRYARIIATGEPERFLDESKSLGRAFEVYALRVGPAEARRVAVMLKDITERKRRESNSAFLDEASNDLAGLTDVDATMRMLGEKIGRHFRASACVFTEMDEAAGTITGAHEWHRADVPGLLGQLRHGDHHTAEFYRASRAGEMYVVRDVMSDARVKGANDAALGVHAYINVPFVRDGAWRFNLTVCDAVARDWRDDEITLVRELTTRIWMRLERARGEAALRESEARQVFLLGLGDVLRPLADPADVLKIAVAALGRRLGVNRALYCEVQADLDTLLAGPAYVDGVASLPPLLRMSELGETAAAQIRGGQTVLIHDVLADDRFGPAEAAVFAAAQLRSSITMPLVKEGRLISAISVHQATPRTWTAADVALLEAVAERTWSAVERARAENALRESRETLAREVAALARLHDASTRLWQCTDLPSGIEQILDEGIWLLGADMGNVQLLNPATRMLEIAAHRGLQPDFLEHFREVSAEDGSACGRSLRSGESIMIEDVEADAPYASHRGVAMAAGYRAVLTTPLLDVTGKPLGMFSAHFRHPHKPLERDRRRLELYLRQAVGFVERQRIDAVRRELEARQSFMLQLADTLRPLADSADIERQATRMLGEALGATRAYYACIETDGDTAVVRSEQVGTPLSHVERHSLSAVAPNLVLAWRAGRTTLTADLDRDPWFSHAAKAGFASVTTRSLLAVPLVKGGRLVALLGLHQSTPRAWTADEVALAEETAERTWATSEKARAEEASRHSEARLQLALDAAEMGTVAWYPQEDRGESDARTLALFGLAPGEEMSYARAQLLIPPEDRLAHAEAIARALDPDGEGVFRCEHRIHRPNDGAERWITNFGRTRFDGMPPVAVAVTGVCADVTARKSADQALRQSVDRLRRMVNVPGVGVLTFDTAGALIEANTAFLDMVGYSRQDFVETRLSWRDLTPEEYMEASQREFERVFATGVCGPYEKEYLRKDGSRIWLMFVGADMGDGTLVEYALDISDRKRSEELLRWSEQRARGLLAEATSARTQAEAANRAKDEFLATLSHELRTPLAAILLWARLLRSGVVPADQVSRAIDAIAHSADSQSRLIEDLLDLSRLASQKLVLSVSPTRVATVVREAADMVSPMMAAKKLAFAVDLDESVGVAAVDASRFQQILGNLLANAAKFTPEGGAVTLRVRKRDAALEVEVADTGEGIAPELLSRLFERFWQADMASTRQHMGLGIGLALAKQLVELHGGTIDGRSDGVGRGAVFRVRVPWVAVDADDAPHESAAAVPASSALARLMGVTVLLVEDDPNTREAMQWTLERVGATVVPAPTAAAAIAALDAAPVDVVVSDVGLPGVSGLVLIERIAAECRRRGFPTPPSCAVSAHARDLDRQRALDAGFDTYLAKPVTAERLIEVVADLVARTLRVAPGSAVARGARVDAPSSLGE